MSRSELACNHGMFKIKDQRLNEDVHGRMAFSSHENVFLEICFLEGFPAIIKSKCYIREKAGRPHNCTRDYEQPQMVKLQAMSRVSKLFNFSTGLKDMAQYALESQSYPMPGLHFLLSTPLENIHPALSKTSPLKKVPHEPIFNLLPLDFFPRSNHQENFYFLSFFKKIQN